MPIELHLPEPSLAWEHGALRPWKDGDAKTLVDAWRDAENARWNPVPDDPSIERARAWIAGCDHRLETGRALDLCIVNDDHRVVGEVGLSGFNVERRAALIGYWLLADARGGGTASHAVDALTSWSLSPAGLDLNLIVARCASANLASHAVAQRAGFHHARSDDGHELWARHRGAPS